MNDGIVRNLDNLGRLVIPKEMRKMLKVMEGDPVIITKSNNSVIIRKYVQGCMFCGSSECLVEHENVHICTKCLNDINKKRIW